jgi:hypothetical protein
MLLKKINQASKRLQGLDDFPSHCVWVFLSHQAKDQVALMTRLRDYTAHHRANVTTNALLPHLLLYWRDWLKVSLQSTNTSSNAVSLVVVVVVVTPLQLLGLSTCTTEQNMLVTLGRSSCTVNANGVCSIGCCTFVV